MYQRLQLWSFCNLMMIHRSYANSTVGDVDTYSSIVGNCNSSMLQTCIYNFIWYNHLNPGIRSFLETLIRSLDKKIIVEWQFPTWVWVFSDYNKIRIPWCPLKISLNDSLPHIWERILSECIQKFQIIRHVVPKLVSAKDGCTLYT